jgi:hypothetical protein
VNADLFPGMKRRHFFPKARRGMLVFYQNLCTKAPGYTAQLGVTPEELELLNTACTLWHALTDLQNHAKRFAASWTSLRDGCFLPTSSFAPPAWPVWTGPDAPPVEMETNLETKIRAILQRWKTAPGYTEAIGVDLGIVGAQTYVDAAALTPELRVGLVGGRPLIRASLLGCDALEVHVDRGNGFALFDVSMGAPLEDPHPLPPPGASEVWTYRAILREQNQRVGQWSNSVAVPVIGI